MKKTLAVFFLLGLLVGCTGIPLRSLPRLIKLQSELLQAKPAEFMVAIQADARMAPPPGATPLLLLTIRPAEAGSFEAIDKKLPMRFTTSAANTLGLAAPGAGRRWLIYSLPPESQTELVRIQEFFRNRPVSKGKGGTLSVGIAQDGVAAKDPVFASTRWESWLQTSQQEGFYLLWTGTVADLLRQAQPNVGK